MSFLIKIQNRSKFNETLGSRHTRIIYSWQKYLYQKLLSLQEKMSRLFTGTLTWVNCHLLNNINGFRSIDIIELQRVYGSIKRKNDSAIESEMSELENKNDNQMRHFLQQENELLKKLLDEKESHIASLKQAMLLLEHKKKKILVGFLDYLV